MNKEERILAERAAKLAEPVESDKNIKKVEYVLFTLADQLEYGIIYTDVLGIVKPNEITPVPLSPGAIKGVINWRGNLISVVDLNYYFSNYPNALGKAPWVIVVKFNANQVGLAVNEVRTNRFFLDTELELKRQGSAKKLAYIKGIVSKKIAIIDVKSLLEEGGLPWPGGK